ncbi:MAG: hypothetical protein NZ808_08210 [Myxococcota bacterium]|nr:hypothetical protein [Myxococcota bacterium]
MSRMEIRIPTTTLKRLLLGLVIVLSFMGFLVPLAHDRWPLETFDMPLGLVSLSDEQNLPTWFSSHLILLSASILALISFSESGHGAEYRRHWRGLAFVFAYLSLDEAIELHEGLNLIADTSGFLYFGWVVPFGILVLILAVTYIDFLRHLPEKTRNQFVIAGAIFVGGALGVEMILGYWTDLHGEENLTYGMIDWVEESLEMCGMSLFAWSAGSFLLAPAEGVVLRKA